MSWRTAAVAAAAAFVAGIALAGLYLRAASPAGSGSCGPAAGGRAGARVQLLAVDVGERYVVFTFGYRAGSGDFDVPAFGAFFIGGGDAQVLRVLVQGASSENPDGTPSYAGPWTIGGEGVVREVALVEEREDGVVWQISLTHRACPRALVKTYPMSSTFPRAQVALTFDSTTAVTLEPPQASGGRPVIVSGLGFARSSRIRVTIQGSEAGSTTANAAGAFETPIIAPSLAPGRYRLTATDAAGQSASATLTISGP